MKKKTVIFLVSLFLILLIGTGITFLVINALQDDNKKEPEKIEEKEEPKQEEQEKIEEFSYIPLMYKVCDEDSCIHILGSMHIGDDRITKFDQKVIDIYEDSEAIAVELSNEESNKMKLTDFVYQDGTTIKDHLPEDINNKLIEFSKKHKNYNYNAFQYYNLGMNATLLENILYMEANFTVEGADGYFIKKATKDKKEVISIEKIEDQLKPLFGYSDEFYAKQIEQTIDNYNISLISTKLLYGIYLKADEKSLTNLMSNSFSDAETEEEKKYVEELIIKRNNTMTNAAKDYLENDKNVLIIVGAAHVVYKDNGIIPILRQDPKYKITRVE